ncbi:MAG TPA: ABC transporter permease [Solirubrobacterales bacterium]|nr:ABC transporter permease [Solirubrobacterales bacterium]
MKRWLAPILLVVILIGAWQIAASTGAIASALSLESFLVPSPSEIASSLWENRSLLADNAWVTLREVILGFGCGLVAGVGFAVVLHFSETMRRATYPLLVASQAIPIVAIAPILIVLFGFGIWPKLVIVALICFFPITVNALDGLRSVDPAAIKLMRTLDASRWQTFRRVEAPTALPYAFSGAKIAVAVAVIGAVFAEWAGGSNSGLGVLIRVDNAQLETARLFAEVVVLSAIAIALFAALALAERCVVTWR